MTYKLIVPHSVKNCPELKDYLLQCVTARALHLFDTEAVHLMILFCIMAQSADIQFTTAGCLEPERKDEDKIHEHKRVV